MLGIRTWGRMMVGADKSTELWQPRNKNRVRCSQIKYGVNVWPWNVLRWNREMDSFFHPPTFASNNFLLRKNGKNLFLVEIIFFFFVLSVLSKIGKIENSKIIFAVFWRNELLLDSITCISCTALHPYFHFEKKHILWAVVMAHLAQQLFRMPEVCSLNLVCLSHFDVFCEPVTAEQCDQIGRFIGLRASF